MSETNHIDELIEAAKYAVLVMKAWNHDDECHPTHVAMTDLAEAIDKAEGKS